MEIVFLADSVSAESWPRDKVRVVVETKASEILDDLDVEDRIKGLDAHEVLEAIGINEALSSLSEEEIHGWIKSSGCDPIDLLNAIGSESIFEWINSQED